MTDCHDPLPSSPTSNPNPNPVPSALIYPRRQPFDHGLLPITKLIFTNHTQTLGPFKLKLAAQSSTHRDDSAFLCEALQISIDYAILVLDTLAAVLHSKSDPIMEAKSGEITEFKIQKQASEALSLDVSGNPYKCFVRRVVNSFFEELKSQVEAQEEEHDDSEEEEGKSGGKEFDETAISLFAG